MNAPEFKTLADPMFQSIFNKGEVTMNAESNAIDCQTGEERPSTTIPSSLGQAVPISGVSGAVYAPMDTSPQAQQETRLDQLTNLLNETLKQLVIELTNSKDQQTNLVEAVDVALSNAHWFKENVEDMVVDAVRETDFDYEIGNSVERYMRNELDINDHVDFHDLVNDRVDDLIDDIVSEKVEEAVEARLADLLEEKLANARITINF